MSVGAGRKLRDRFFELGGWIKVSELSSTERGLNSGSALTAHFDPANSQFFYAANPLPLSAIAAVIASTQNKNDHTQLQLDKAVPDANGDDITTYTRLIPYQHLDTIASTIAKYKS